MVAVAGGWGAHCIVSSIAILHHLEIHTLTSPTSTQFTKRTIKLWIVKEMVIKINLRAHYCDLLRSKIVPCLYVWRPTKTKMEMTTLQDNL